MEYGFSGRESEMIENLSEIMGVWIRVREGFVTKHADQGPTGLGVY